MKRRNGELFSLDVLALALLTCLLASVVGMLVMGEDGKTLKVRKSIHQESQRLSASVGQAQASLQQLASKAGATVTLANELGDALAEASDLDRKLKNLQQGTGENPTRNHNDRQEMAAAQAELQRLSAELAKLQQADAPKAGPGIHQIVGDFKGSYILIECVKDAVVVYPFKTRIACNAKNESKRAKDEFERNLKFLLNHIVETGFVVFVVRPAGWFENSYDSLYPPVTKQLAALEARGGKHVGVCKFPLADTEAIGPFLPVNPQAPSAPSKDPVPKAMLPAKPAPST